MRFLYFLLISIFIFFLAACDSEETYAPVTEINTIEPIPKSGIHRATDGETFYEIAWRYGLDYRDLAMRNRINPSYSVEAGQVIYLRDHAANVSNNKLRAPLAEPAKSSSVQTQHIPEQTFVRVTPVRAIPAPSVSLQKPTLISHGETNHAVSHWQWPVRGRVLSSFYASHKGINIAGKAGDPVYAAAAGNVVYCGDGLRGYGNLIILKHNNLYLSAYAHNQIILVKEGEWVKQGQKIAEMGKTGSDKVMLHFEIRRAGLPVDPVKLLNS